jgi:hypothetical protein
MNLLRTDFLETGIFGLLTNSDQSLMLCTLEHAYPVGEGQVKTYFPKILPGVYTCKRGMHRLEGMAQPFETFEIMGVEGHDNILFHAGNVNADSSGCVLLGLSRLGDKEILQSRAAFQQFMESLKYVDSFELVVT